MDRGGSYHCIGGGDKNHAQKKKIQKGKWLSEDALQIAEKRRKAKGKEEKERYICLNEVTKNRKKR